MTFIRIRFGQERKQMHLKHAGRNHKELVRHDFCHLWRGLFHVVQQGSLAYLGPLLQGPLGAVMKHTCCLWLEDPLFLRLDYLAWCNWSLGNFSGGVEDFLSLLERCLQPDLLMWWPYLLEYNYSYCFSLHWLASPSNHNIFILHSGRK